MRFTTQRYTINWQALEVGIMMGCVISPFIFIMCMEMLLRGAKDLAEGEVLDGGIVHATTDESIHGRRHNAN